MLDWINGVGHWINGFWTATKFWWHGGAKEVESAIAYGKTLLTVAVIGYFLLKIAAKVSRLAKEKKSGSR